MEEKGFLTWFPGKKKTLRNNYAVLEEASKMLGFSSEEIASLIKAFRRTSCGILNFQSGHLEISLGKEDEGTGLHLTLEYEKGRVRKLADYSYNLRLLDTLLCRKPEQAEGEIHD